MLDATPLTGRHLIAGDWVEGASTFRSAPAAGEGFDVAAGGAAEVDRAVRAAEAAFETYGWTAREDRARFLETIADEIEARGPALTEIGAAESGLPTARLEGERGRTTGQLRMFAALIRETDHLDIRRDPALPDRAPAPRPELAMIQRPIGPVGVFGASNFPLAFSTAGGDTASALAAGCPVGVKGHPGHPGCAEIVAQAVAAAVAACGMPAGVFSLIQSNTNEAGAALVQHPLIRAIGFTGSYRGGKALFDLACARPEPIPFFGELGAINPVFVLPAALGARGAAIAEGWAGSLTMGVGQFCTNPGVVVLPAGPEGDAFAAAAAQALSGAAPGTMLSDGIAAAYRKGVEDLANHPGLAPVAGGEAAEGRAGLPAVFQVAAEDWLAAPDLAEEVFGPAGLLVRVTDAEQTRAVARELTVTLQMDDADAPAARALMPILERKAGRILANGFPTGVEVASAMVHGGPFPASTNFGHTSVGTLAIRRFLRPVCFQNIPAALLPGDLRG